MTETLVPAPTSTSGPDLVTVATAPASSAQPDTISVVICAYTEDRWDDIVAAVDSVRHQSLRPHEIILVIDHCPELFAQARNGLTGVILMENGGLKGLSDARNFWCRRGQWRHRGVPRRRRSGRWEMARTPACRLQFRRRARRGRVGHAGLGRGPAEVVPARV